MHQILPFAVRPGSLWRGASAGFPLCLRASVVKVGLGDWVGRPFGARGVMGVPLTQAVEAVKKMILQILALCIFNNLHCG